MIWVRVRKISDRGNTLYLPKHLADTAAQNTALQFGHNRVIVSVRPLKESGASTSSFEEPFDVELSENAADSLLIVESMVYKLTVTESGIHIGPVIGLLMGDQSYYYHNRNLSGFTDSMGIYSKTGGLYILFRDISIDWKAMNIKGLYYDPEDTTWKYAVLPFPGVVFRRAFKTDQTVIDRLKALTGNKVFNSDRLDKWEIYKLLVAEEKFKVYLPETKKLTSEDDFNALMNSYPKVIMKPAGLSRGRGICYIEKIDDLYAVYDYRISNRPRFTVMKRGEVGEFLYVNHFLESNYIIQQQIHLAAINGAPFDMRVVMGKDPDNQWNCRGIECRLAGPKNPITNIARGGQALTINNAIRLAFGPSVDSSRVKNKIISIAVQFCGIMDHTGMDFAEFGLDFAMDADMNYWFIEANVRPVFRGFKRLDYGNYLYIKNQSLLYAASLSGFAESEAENGSRL